VRQPDELRYHICGIAIHNTLKRRATAHLRQRDELRDHTRCGPTLRGGEFEAVPEDPLAEQTI
jgi:hypothetical protein